MDYAPDKGLTIHARDLLRNQKENWTRLNREHGADAVYTWDNRSISFFPSIDTGIRFTEMVTDTMPYPAIGKRIQQTREEYNEKVARIAYAVEQNNRIAKGGPVMNFFTQTN